MKCEDIEEDNKGTELWFPNSALGHLNIPYIKEEIKLYDIVFISGPYLRRKVNGINPDPLIMLI
uniref:Uncharacterized protein n=1 Tax=Timema poppense TaxID=170557 RepID=A0A7R9DSR9_TIMPO|nr:unnamed protein product [Timema poppensis]